MKRRKTLRTLAHLSIGKSKCQLGRKISIGYNSYNNSTPENQFLPNGRNDYGRPLSVHSVYCVFTPTKFCQLTYTNGNYDAYHEIDLSI